MTNPEYSELVFQEIRELIQELHPELRRRPTVTLDSLLDRDLGLDSMGRVELLSRLEGKTGIRLPEKILTTAETPRDIIRALKSGTVTGGPSFTPEETVEEVAVGELDQSVHQATTLTEVLVRHARNMGDRPHIVIEDFRGEPVSITFAGLLQGAREIAAGLQRFELEPGDTVALMLPTSREYFLSFFGILLTGCVPVPLYPPTRPSQIEEHLRRHKRILGNAGAKVLITVPEVRMIGRLLQSGLRSLKRVVTADELTGYGSGEPVKRHGSDTAFLQYTSGSTGDPKGVILTHANLLANIRAMGEVVEVRPDDVFVSWLPLYHDMGLIGAWLGSLYYACRLVVMSPLTFLSRPERWLWAIHKYRGTLSASPNFGYEFCCRRVTDEAVKGVDLSSWRMAFNGAEAVSSETIERFTEKFAPYGFRRESYAPVYGLAECSVGLAFPPVGRGPLIDHIERERFLRTGEAVPTTSSDALKFPACGRPLPRHQVRVIDPTGRELPERRQGRLEFKGPSATSGYLLNPEKTKELFHGEWLDTGDQAYIAGGDIYITGRVKDIIIRGGRNVYPHEYEEVVGELEGIRKGCVAVFGTHHTTDGTERVVVLAESRKQDQAVHEELKKQINDIGVDLLGMPPDEVCIVPPGTVLKTSSGKVRRSSTKQVYEQGLIGKKKRAVWLQLAYMTLIGVPPFLRKFAGILGDYGYAAYCWTVGSVMALPVMGLLFLPLPPKAAWKTVHRYARLLARLTGTGLSVSGQEHLENGEALLLVSNHMSYLDAFVLTASMEQPCSFVAKAELARNPFVKRVLERLETIFVERFDVEQSREDAEKISSLVGEGRRILFFAEGTLQRMPGLLPFQMGAFSAAVRNSVRIVPITLTGTRGKLRGGSWFPRRGNVQVRISAPITPEGTDWQAALELRNAVRRAILQQVGEPDLAEEFSSLAQFDLAKPETGGKE